MKSSRNFCLKSFTCKMEKVLWCYRNEITLGSRSVIKGFSEKRVRRVKKLQLTNMLSFQFFLLLQFLYLSFLLPSVSRISLSVEIEKLFIFFLYRKRKRTMTKGKISLHGKIYFSRASMKENFLLSRTINRNVLSLGFVGWSTTHTLWWRRWEVKEA